MENNQSIGLSLEEQAKSLSCMCQDKVACPGVDLKLPCKFTKPCIEIRASDWFEYLENRQIPAK